MRCWGTKRILHYACLCTAHSSHPKSTRTYLHIYTLKCLCVRSQHAHQGVHSHRHEYIHIHRWWRHFSFSLSEHTPSCSYRLLSSSVWSVKSSAWGRGRNVITCRCAERHWHKSTSYSFNGTSRVLSPYSKQVCALQTTESHSEGQKLLFYTSKHKLKSWQKETTWEGVELCELEYSPPQEYAQCYRITNWLFHHFDSPILRKVPLTTWVLLVGAELVLH